MPWSAPALLDKLRANLVARAGLAGVNVFTAPAGDDERGAEAIELFAVDGTQAWASLGNKSADDAYQIEGSILILRPVGLPEAGFTAGESASKAARLRAGAVLAELEAELKSDPTVGATCRHARVVGVALLQGSLTEARWAQVVFRIGVHQRI